VVKFIIAVDPGVTTGVATYNYYTRVWETYQIPYEPIRLYEFLRGKNAAYASGEAVRNTAVICESFDYRPSGKYDFGGSRAIPKVDLTARNVIGILELACAYNNITIVYQSPSTVNGDDGKKTKNPSVFWTDEKVKKLKLYKPSHVHAMDAVKHILHYRAFTLSETNLFTALKQELPSALKEVML
jgi:hypothetical protein